jgi:hypothetical protein
MWIGMSGFARAGKDTVANGLVDCYGFQRVAFATKLKEMMLALDPLIMVTVSSRWGAAEMPTRYSDYLDEYGPEKSKEHPEVRRLLQVFGTEVMREQFGSDVWIDLALDGKSLDEDWVITDARFLNEARAVKDRGGYMVRVNRPGVEPPNLHASEVEMIDYPFDYVIENDGTLADLTGKVMDMMEDLRSRA